MYIQNNSTPENLDITNALYVDLCCYWNKKIILNSIFLLMDLQILFYFVICTM